MKIVHIYKDYFPVLGGMENHIRHIAEAFAAQGHDVTVLVTNTSNRTSIEMMNGVKVIKAARQIHVQSAPISMQFPYWVAKTTHQADIVHLHAPYPIGEACNLLFGRGKKTVMTWQSDVVRQKTLLKFYTPILQQVLKRADHIILSSEIYGRSSPWVSPHLHKCTAVPLSIDPARFKPLNTASEGLKTAEMLGLRQRLGLPADKFLLLSVGRLRYYKGLNDLIRALPQLPPDVIAVLVGIGPMANEWRALAQSLGVSDRIIWPGEASDADVLDYYRACDVYINPANSRAEAFGISILEALASGLPVISTEVGTATSWINLHEVTGLVTPPSDPAALASAILTLYNAPALRQAYASTAQHRAFSEFNENLMLQRIEAVYQNVSREK
ncbi:MAG: glycosyltransferase [Anaerolineae bacterium]|nr:glycosyltransferase [Anaerolineae bacterium]